MTTEKLPKKQKLRNAEYYNLQDTLDMLYQKSKDGAVFTHLMELISSNENIRMAYRNLKTNGGSKTPGTDGMTIQNLAQWNLDSLIKHVQKRLSWYRPQSVKRVEIPKAGNPSKKRPLGIPTIMDRLIQQSVLQILEPICEAKFHERSNGFRPNRSCEHAIAQSERFIQCSHLHHVVDIDIHGFFDNVNHAKLLKQMWTLGIRDKRLLSIISAMLKAEVAGIGFPVKGTPQGGLCSPLFGNIVLNELDWWIASQWETFPTRHPYKGTVCANGTVNQGMKYTSLRKSSRLKECYIVRYADDFKIFCRTHETAEKMFIATKNWLKERLNLDISPEKSKVVNLEKQYTEFLGFRMRVHPKGKRPDGSTRYTVKTRMTEKALNTVQKKAKEQVRKIQHSMGVARYCAIQQYNAYLLGIHNYYRIANHIALDAQILAFQFHRIQICRLGSHLSQTGKPLPQYIARTYGKSKQLRYVDGYPLIPIGYFKHRTPLQKKKSVNQYTPEGRAEIHKTLNCVDMSILIQMMKTPNPWQSAEFNDNRISLYAGQQGRCAVTGEPLQLDGIKGMQCHHKIPVESGGTDIYSNLILVTFPIHKLIHATDPLIIQKHISCLNNDSKALAKLNKLRLLVENEPLQF